MHTSGHYTGHDTTTAECCKTSLVVSYSITFNCGFNPGYRRTHEVRYPKYQRILFSISYYNNINENENENEK